VVYLVGHDVVDKVCKLAGVRKVPVMQEKPGAGYMGVRVDVVYPVGIKGAGPPYKPVYLVAFV
jgi:hypothetical protein